MTETNEPAETAETADTPRTAETPAPATPAPLHWKLVIDCANPQSQADFWAAALHYAVEDNSAFIERLLELGAVPREAVVEFHARLAFRDLVAVRHPDDPYDQDSGTGLGGGCCSSGCRRRRPERTGSISICTRRRGARGRGRATGEAGGECAAAGEGAGRGVGGDGGSGGKRVLRAVSHTGSSM